MNFKFGIVIINWNRRNDTIECLDSIAKYIGDEKFFVVLVDNNSREKIDDLVNNYEFNTYVVNNKSNYGFAKGNNIGIKFALEFSPEYIFLLNNDTVLVDNSIMKLFSILDYNNNYGVLGAVNYYYDVPDKIWQAGSDVNYFNGEVKTITEIINDDEIYSVDYVPGSSMVIRSSLLEKVNFLNENYFAYWEENELCYKVKSLNYKVGFVPETKILHKVKKRNRSAIYTYLYLRNKLYFFRDKTNFFVFSFICVNTVLKFFIKTFVNVYLYDNKKNWKAFYFALKDVVISNMGYGSLDKLK